MFVVSAVLWFFMYTPDGDMGRGFTRISVAAILLFVACTLLVVSSVSRFLLVRKAPRYRTTMHYVMLGVTAIPSVIILVSFIGFMLTIFYEKYLM